MLNQMPPEVVIRICEYACENDLKSLIQVSQRYHALAAAVLYRNISLHLDHLQSSITRWTELLDRTKSWKAPRCVELGITMRRQWNRPGEDIAVLKAIGRLRHLSDFNLVFYPSGIHSGRDRAVESIPLYDWVDQIRDAMINSAIGIDLTKAVFNTVMSSATSNGPRDDVESYLNTSRLRCMSLKAIHLAYFNEELDFHLGNVVREIGRRWVVKRHCIGADLEAQRDELESDIWEPPEYLGTHMEPVWRTIWLDRGGDDEWEAFPLKAKE